MQESLAHDHRMNRKKSVCKSEVWRTEFGRRVIAPLLADFRASCPSLEVLLVLSDAGLNPVDDDLDMVLRNGVPDDPQVVVRKVLASRRIVCATPQYLERNGTPRVPDDLLRHDCIR